ncbi:MAG: STAS domain-containing protein [Thermoguttaceae bacterium]|nr:STAS domain-containing protein [Thermoguttaceae bacterium]
MEIKEIRDGDKLTIALEGRLDTMSSAAAESNIQKKLDGILHLTLDLEALEYVSSAGLRAVLSLDKILDSKGGDMIITHVREEVLEIFEITGFTDILKIV